MKSTCTNCGASIKNVVMINGKPFGTTCAEGELGIDLPAGFKGDGQAYKKADEAKSAKQRAEFAEIKMHTKNNWGILRDLGRAKTHARRRSNDWEVNFIDSIARQLGLGNINEMAGLYDTYQEAVDGWNNDTSGSFPYLHNGINTDRLSEKQWEIFERILEQ